MPAKQDARAEPEAAPETLSRLYGVIDMLRSNRIAGWAIDRADAEAAVEVDILRDGRRVATVRADRPRRDLEANGLGTGRYGFSAPIDPPLEPGFEFTVSAIARAPDGESVELKRAGPAATADDPTRRLLAALHLKLHDLHQLAEAPRIPEVARIEDLLARIELAQSRLDQALDTASPRETALGPGVKALVALSLAVGLASLGLGLLSLWTG